jgi:hypothetical protein
MALLNERRIVNLNKDSYEQIKEYCESNALNLPKWLEKIALEKISKKENSMEDVNELISLLKDSLQQSSNKKILLKG